MTTTATKKDGKIHINGTKTWVTSVRTPTASSWSARTRTLRENKQMSMYLCALGVTAQAA